MAGILYTRFVIPWILSGSEKEKTLFQKRVTSDAVHMYDVSGDVWDDKVFASVVPSSGMVLGRME